MQASGNEFYGLKWVEQLADPRPEWTVELDVNAIKYEAEKAVGPENTQVSFYAQGGFNRLFEIVAGNKTYLMRVSLPVDPYWKTSSEVATLSWVEKNTTMPVPHVVAYNSNRKNAIGFEWMLMTKLPGVNLSKEWRNVSFETKRYVTEQIAEYLVALFSKQKNAIGGLHEGSEDRGRIVAMEFFWNKRLSYDVNRGPFKSSHDWMLARLSVVEQDWQETLDHSQDDAETYDAEQIIIVVKALRGILDVVFPPTSTTEPSMLVHDDMHKSNILVDVDSGRVTGIVDWECVSWLPLWKACDHPHFLCDGKRSTEPVRGSYTVGKDGEVNELYWENLMEWESTRLRQHFDNIMQRTCPEWVQIYDRSGLQRDFDGAIIQCSAEYARPGIMDWIKKVSQGDLTARIGDDDD
ncbi:kinase-like protein [Piedraia hortae CBS 480.64]|uniref:Kinase-like protein n=1 Tax=Piedraia hortae CBS 480.64 TaxID=1314780 RepID=A0A6A7CA22_9PEZI|nr:kinase-like protein [Piedraia hortae CBS 480.64]